MPQSLLDKPDGHARLAPTLLTSLTLRYRFAKPNALIQNSMGDRFLENLSD